jgi:hypothetical protein
MALKAAWFHDNTYFKGGILNFETWERSILSPTPLPEESANAPAAEKVHLLIDPSINSSTYGLPRRPESVADRIAIMLIRTRRFLASTCHESMCGSQRALAEVRHRARRMKDERPMVFLGLIAGSAFVLGMSLRIGRSRH